MGELEPCYEINNVAIPREPDSANSFARYEQLTAGDKLIVRGLLQADMLRQLWPWIPIFGTHNIPCDSSLRITRAVQGLLRRFNPEVGESGGVKYCLDSNGNTVCDHVMPVLMSGPQGGGRQGGGQQGGGQPEPPPPLWIVSLNPTAPDDNASRIFATVYVHYRCD